ncbi:MAG TPA: 5-formyltetrahydrofolate cyclo-ligase [Kineosporiaceae bacterium]
MPGTTGTYRSATSSADVLLDDAGRAGREATKRAMRERIRAERRLRTPEERERDAETLTEVLLELPEVAASGCVAAYASTRDEPDTQHLRATLRRLGVRVLLPICSDDGTLDWAEDDGPLRPGRGPGGPEPGGPRLGREGVRQATVVLAPALAVDTLGHRLGQGGGFYDRTLRLLHASVPVLALVHDGEVLDAAVEPVPSGPHDEPVDAAVTPRRYLRLGLSPS